MTTTGGIAGALGATPCTLPPAAGIAAKSPAPGIAVTEVISATVADAWKAWTTTEGIALFLASGAMSYVTGAIVPMDGRSNPVI